MGTHYLQWNLNASAPFPTAAAESGTTTIRAELQQQMSLRSHWQTYITDDDTYDNVDDVDDYDQKEVSNFGKRQQRTL